MAADFQVTRIAALVRFAAAQQAHVPASQLAISNATDVKKAQGSQGSAATSPPPPPSSSSSRRRAAEGKDGSDDGSMSVRESVVPSGAAQRLRMGAHAHALHVLARADAAAVAQAAAHIVRPGGEEAPGAQGGRQSQLLGGSGPITVLSQTPGTLRTAAAAAAAMDARALWGTTSPQGISSDEGLPVAAAAAAAFTNDAARAAATRRLRATSGTVLWVRLTLTASGFWTDDDARASQLALDAAVRSGQLTVGATSMFLSMQNTLSLKLFAAVGPDAGRNCLGR